MKSPLDLKIQASEVAKYGFRLDKSKSGAAEGGGHSRAGLIALSVIPSRSWATRVAQHCRSTSLVISRRS